MTEYIKNPDRKWFQVWKTELVPIFPLTSFMCEVFRNTEEIKDPMFGSRSITNFYDKKDKKFISNPMRKTWQFWKQKTIKNRHYDPDFNPNTPIDIVRGNHEI